MKWNEFLTEWIIGNPFIINLIKYLVWVIFILISIQILRGMLKKNLPDTATRYKSQKGIEIIGYILLIILSLSFFTGNITDFTLAIGLLSAGLAFTLQELILSVAGSLYIFIVKVYKPGDRIEINGIKVD